MYLFYDTETTGLPANYNAPLTDVKNWPRIIQLGWMLYDEERNLLNKKNYLILPDGWTMPTGDFWVKHGYTQEKNLKYGIPISQALDEIIVDINRCQYMVAHNMSYDYKIMGCEMYRASKRAEHRPKKICTKESSTEFCKLYPLKFGKHKWPNLGELHNKLFNTGFDGAHDALADVEAMARCFFELIDRNIINLEQEVLKY